MIAPSPDRRPADGSASPDDAVRPAHTAHGAGRPHPPRRPRWTLPKRITAGLVAAGLVGVVASTWSGPASVAVPDQPSRDVAAWTMPLDAAVGVPFDAVSAAEDVRLAPCLAEQGWDEPAPARDAALLLLPDMWADDLVVVPPLDAARAERWGHGPVVDPQASAWRTWARAHNADVRLGQMLDVCLPGARSGEWAAAFEGQEVQSRARELRRTARQRAEAAPDVVDAAERWRACLVDAVGEDGTGEGVPLSPERLLVADVSDGDVTAPVTDQSRATALEDADCQVSSGYREALYDAQWSEESFVTRDDAELLGSDRARAVARTAVLVRGVLLGP